MSDETGTGQGAERTIDFDSIWAVMQSIEGWFFRDASKLLFETACRILADLPSDSQVVEIGSYQGRSTVLLASVIGALRPSGRVAAIDPHEGTISLSGGRPNRHGAPTFEALRANLRAAGLLDYVEIIRQRSTDVVWTRPIGLLLIDGLHDYGSVRADFRHYRDSVVHGGVVAFDDYSPNFPDVVRLVDEVISAGEFRCTARAGDLILLCRQ